MLRKTQLLPCPHQSPAATASPRGSYGVHSASLLRWGFGGANRRKKDTLIPYPWDESMICFVVPPRFGGGFLPCGPRLSGRLPAISARGALYARSADVLRACCRRELSANAPLSARLSAVLLPRHSDEIVQRSPRFCRLTIRQSRSPRCRPRISISAEARFVAHGTL